MTDHPRMRGEHYPCGSRAEGSVGSSPHARGTLRGLSLPHGSTGIIPACAGNTPIRCSGRLLSGDHPRMRGEHCFVAMSAPCLLGSSPHARGTLFCGHSICSFVGIIPACAGNTVPVWLGVELVQDHPRMRGEHVLLPLSMIVVMGSSPHARGTQKQHHHQQSRRGIIPACAGNTPSGERCTRRCQDHPRMRGEHVNVLVVALVLVGSSPHARGTPDDLLRPVCAQGIIPACAGNTA